MVHEPREPSSPIVSLARIAHSNPPLLVSTAWQWLQANTFAPHWLPVHWRHPATCYVLVIVLQLAAAVITRLLIGFLSEYSYPGVVELLIVALVTLSWGAGPGLFAALVGLVLEETVVMPKGRLGLGDLLEIAVFLTVGVSISLVASVAQRSRRRAEAQGYELAAMRHAQERMDEFLATASHELRTPLAATVGFIQLADHQSERLVATARDEKSDLVRLIEAVHICVREARQSGERLSRLVISLLDTSLARVGKLELNRTPCDLAALVRDQVEAVRVMAPERAIRLHILAEGPVWIVADPNRVGQVITNYLTNALKYALTAQAIDIQMTITSGWARVAVEDRGPGLPASERERIWQRYYRTPGRSTQNWSSNGLGVSLHICKVIIELHGGQVGVESEVGKGSTFWFTLPLGDGAS